MAAYFSSKTKNNGLAYIGGRVYTIDAERPWASAFIVSAAGVFQAVGDDDAILKIANEQGMAIVNLSQQFVMPGIHDAHTHLLMSGEKALWQVDIATDATDLTIAQKLKEAQCHCRYAHVTGDWVVGNFYLPELFPDNKPDRKYLDEAFPNTPVIVRGQSLHKILVNSEGLRRLGIDERTSVSPPGGVFVRRQDGSLTGELMETATAVLFKNLPIPPLNIVKECIQRSIKICHQFGITSVQEASANTLYLHALRELEEENQLVMDVYTHIVWGNEFFSREAKESLDALLTVAEAFESAHVKTKFAKFWLDGSPMEPGTTHCTLDAKGVPDPAMLFYDTDTLFAAVARYDALGMICKMHAAGEGSVRQALDVFERVRAENPRGPRHEIAHCNLIHDHDLPRMAALRITAEMSPAIFHLVDTFPDSRDALRYDIDAIHSHGGKVTLGTDWPILDTPNLLVAAAAFLERLTIDHLGQETVGSRELSPQAKREKNGPVICRLLTLGAAEALGKDSEVGSIEVGKKANFVAFSHDLSRGEFAEASVLTTWFEGKRVFSRDEM